MEEAIGVANKNIYLLFWLKWREMHFGH